MQIEDKYNKVILEYCYNNFLKSFNYYELNIPSNFYINFTSFEEGLLHSKIDKKDFYFSLEQLTSKEHIKSTYQFGRIERIYLTLKGVFFYEKQFLIGEKIITKLITRVLEFIKKIDDDETHFEKKIEIEEFLEIANLEDTGDNKNRLFWTLSIIQGDFVLENSIFYIHRDFYSDQERYFKFTNLNRRILKKKGEEFLNYQLNLINLFINIRNDFEKALLLTEYNDIKLFYGLEKWKEVVIKMGSILEYLVTKKFLESKGKHFMWKKINRQSKPVEINLISDKTFFSVKLSYIIENSVFGIKHNQNWSFVKNNIREYRNYIHLTKFIKSKIIFEKSLIDKLLDVFEILVRLF
ncbi:hypothetical protein LCGC14_0517720 [marine sediment metagenome]|uniref:Uncharacterized protein n=1 Tax=marine sediment metagenome TaxID=412755 RepID=A0A0F9RZG2_9ZZZZ|nr:hypothetical protein [bacterium]